MDFFERQDRARRNTKLLILYFVAGVAMLIAAIYLVTALIFTGASLRHQKHYYAEYEDRPQATLWNPQLLLGVSVATLAVIGLGSGFKTLELARGGSAVATSLGGREVNPNTTDPNERKLLNVVEEMALAAGVPVPQVYLLPDERGINAFAAGHSTSDAVITVTGGCMKLLTRDELQGVIGHEFSHILYGDMRLNIRLMGILFGIICLTVIGRVLIQVRSSNSRDKNPLPLLGLALLIIGWAGVFFGRLIQAAVSRQREFLADASSVQFTRNPAGLVGGLKKIGGFSYGSKLDAPQAEAVSHMFFGNGMGESSFHMMDTHPPLAERIRAIDPNFDGKFPMVTYADRPAPPAIPQPQPQHMPFPFPATSRTQSSPAALAGFGLAGITSGLVTATAGSPTTAHLRYAEGLRSAIPTGLQEAARDSLGACTLIYGLLLSNDQTARSKQLNELAQVVSPVVRDETLKVYPEVTTIATQAKLPLVDLALPGLRHMSPAQFAQFRKASQALVESDGEIDLFEYVLQKIVLRHLEPQFVGARKPIVQFYSLKPLIDDCAVVLSALAHLGQSDPAKIEAAFTQGANVLANAAQVQFQLLAPDECDLSRVDAALERLSQAVPQIKKNVLDACAQTVAADGVIEETEAELLRAIADQLDCPIPPLAA